MRIHLRRILWPTDFSPVSLKAAPYAVSLCEVFKAKLHVIHVAPYGVFTDSTVPRRTGGDKVASEESAPAAAKESLRLIVNQCVAPLSRVVSRVLVGDPWREICEYAQREEIDLIVLATHGSRGLAHMLMGSTSERVVQHAPCPVFTIKTFKRHFLDDDTSRSYSAAVKSAVLAGSISGGSATAALR
jgi:universal stress protein A